MTPEPINPSFFAPEPASRGEERVADITAELERMDTEDRAEPIPLAFVFQRIEHDLRVLDRQHNDSAPIVSVVEMASHYCDGYAAEQNAAYVQRERQREALLLRRMNVEERPGIAACDGINELTHHIANRSVFLRNANGFDYAEHLTKRVDLGFHLGTPDLVPDDLGLRDATHALLARKREQKISFAEYLTRRHPDLHLSATETQRIQEKISPEVFATIDVRAEKVILLLNALEGTTTAYSCAGHADQQHRSPRYRQNFREAYIGLRSRDPQLINALDRAGHRHPEETVEVEKNAALDNQRTPEHLIIRFSQYPDVSWLAQETRPTPLELCRKSQELLYAYFNKRLPDLLLSQDMQQNFALLENRRQQLQQDAFTQTELSPLLRRYARDVTRETDKLMPHYLFGVEYADYFSSERARHRSDLFLQWIASIAEARRKE